MAFYCLFSLLTPLASRDFCENVFLVILRIEFGTVVARRLKPNRATAMVHGSSTTWFQTSRYRRAKVEFNSIN